MKRAILSACVVFAAIAADGSEASAQEDISRITIETPHNGSRPVTLDIHVGPAWYGVGLATGVRLGIPLVRNGFISTLNNAVYLTVGADFYYIRYNPGTGNEYGPGFGFPVGLHWEFYFNEKLSAFAEVGANVFLGPWVFDGDADNDFANYPGAWILFAVGGKFWINDHFALMARLGTPYAAIGMSLAF
ncbi:MAG: hypothetical protein JJ863_07050 [Deltaproteobacteria bacterium]|nr:hypothetical protein [Deltaproteobacteria bacterium]